MTTTQTVANQAYVNNPFWTDHHNHSNDHQAIDAAKAWDALVVTRKETKILTWIGLPVSMCTMFIGPVLLPSVMEVDDGAGALLLAIFLLFALGLVMAIAFGSVVERRRKVAEERALDALQLVEEGSLHRYGTWLQGVAELDASYYAQIMIWHQGQEAQQRSIQNRADIQRAASAGLLLGALAIGVHNRNHH